MVLLVALGQVFIQVFRFSSVSIIPPVLYTHLQLFVAPTRRTVGRILGTIQKEMLFRKYGSIRKVHSNLFIFKLWMQLP